MDLGNTSSETLAIERQEGSITGDLDALSLGMEDVEITRAIGNRVTQSEKFWNDKLNLDNVREKVEKYWLNNYYSQDDLYEFQAEYKDSRIFTAVETLVALISSNPPQPLATQAYDTEASYELAQQLQKALLAKYEDLYLKKELQMIARHLLLGYRLGVMKYFWDDSVGAVQEDGTRFGDVAVRTIRPQRVVIDAGAQNIDDIPLIGEFESDMLEDMLEKFHNKRDEILLECGKSYGTAPDMTKREAYVKVHFSTRDKQTKQKTEAIAWKYKTIVLDSTKSPFWNYEETYQDDQGKTRQANFLTKPQKPYVFFNFLNLGKWVIDDTSLTEQAISLQEIHDKRGRQIVENADQANGGWVFNTTMVKPEDAAAWVNNPGDKILAKGNVNEAVGRFPAPMLPDYVLQDKIDARNEIDNIFGTHGATKGEVTSNKTLGQDVMSQRGDSARLNVLATAIEDGADRLYKGMAQCFKVFYDVPQLIRYSADDGVNFISFGRDQIEDGSSIRVKSGSVLPKDPQAKQEQALAMMAILDPLALARGMGEENPKEWAKRNLMYRLFPDQYMKEFLDYAPDQGAQDPLAMQHIQVLNSGKEVPPETANVTKEHLATHQAFMEAPDFKSLPPEIQQLHSMHVQAELQAAKSAMGMGQERPGMPEQQQPALDSGTPPQLPSGEEPQTGTPPMDMMTVPQ